MSPEAGPRAAAPATGAGTTPPTDTGASTAASTAVRAEASAAVRLVAVRGAIAVDADTAPAIARATHDLLTALLAANRLERDDVVSLMFTQTPDLTATNPALALHEAGWDPPALCAQDAAFAGAPARTLRVLAHLRWDRPGRPSPAYLAGAAPTRPGA